MDDDIDVSAATALDPLILAIDVGTSSARAIVYDAHGRRVSGWEVHRPYSVVTTQDGGVVIDADMLVDLVVDCLDTLVKDVQSSSREIAAVACDTFWHSLMALGRDGRPLTPVLTWADTRSAAAALELRSRLDGPAVHARTGAELHPSYPPAKLLWACQSDPSLVDRVASWLSFAEYLYLRFFGELRVSISMASATGMFDQNSCCWDQGVLDALPLRVEQLSPLADFSHAMSGLQSEYSRRWPLLSAVPWYLGVGDGAASNIGSGGFNEESTVVMVGTSGAIRVVREADSVTIPPGLWTYRADRRRFVQGGALSAGGNVFAWLVQTFGLRDIAELEIELLQLPPDGHGLTILPFLAGDRSPDWNPRAQAVFLGATLHTTQLDLVRACLEAIAYRFGLVNNILRATIPSVRGIIGSGAGLIHSPAWMQIMTDVLADPVTASAVPEASSRGAALMVLETMGVISGPHSLPVPLARRFDPNPEHTQIYRVAMERQDRLYTTLFSDEGRLAADRK